MSGGMYDYKQFMLLQIAEQLNDDIVDVSFKGNEAFK